MELRACSEPGHYVRGAASRLAIDGDTGAWELEFQLVVTEDELKALKVCLCATDAHFGKWSEPTGADTIASLRVCCAEQFQRRQLEAEQRHLQRQQQQ